MWPNDELSRHALRCIAERRRRIAFKVAQEFSEVYSRNVESTVDDTALRQPYRQLRAWNMYKPRVQDVVDVYNTNFLFFGERCRMSVDGEDLVVPYPTLLELEAAIKEPPRHVPARGCCRNCGWALK